MAELKPAVFLDRDGTIIEDPGYLRDCSQVRLLPGAVEAIRQFRRAGFRVVVVTNQSAVARGYLTEAQLAAIHDHLRRMLAAHGAPLDGVYYCPYHPEGVVDAYRKSSDWRKPDCGMLQAAAGDLGLDLAQSWMIGDSAGDVEAGRRAGCRTVLLAPAERSPAAACKTDDRADLVVGDLCQASQVILSLCNNAKAGTHGHGN